MLMVDDTTFVRFGQAFCLYMATRVSLTIFNLLSEYVLGSTFNFKKIGDWAVVTGATDGIGLAFARALAKQGQNVVLISRSKEKLDKVAQEIEMKYNVSTKCISADFSESDIYTNIKQQISDLNISVLVNNVGVSYDHPEYFLEVEGLPNVISKMMSINVYSTVKMTELVLPTFVRKNKGVVLNVSSSAACKPTPLLTLYSASKQFVDTFSKAINCEYASKGVIMQCITPFFVCTKLSKIRRSSLFIPNPDTYVAATLKTVGKSASTYGYLPHAVQGLLFHSVPDWLYMKISLSQMNAVRSKALKRKQQKKE